MDGFGSLMNSGRKTGLCGFSATQIRSVVPPVFVCFAFITGASLVTRACRLIWSDLRLTLPAVESAVDVF